MHHLIDPRHGDNAPARCRASGRRRQRWWPELPAWADALSKVPFVDLGTVTSHVEGGVFDVASALIIGDDGSIAVARPARGSRCGARVNDKLAWYVSRSSGWVAFVLLAITVVWGILGITKVIERKGLPRWMMDLHKYLALLTMVVHRLSTSAALVADNFVHIGWREILVPYAFDWKPGAVTFGIVALYLLVVVQVSSWLRPQLPRKVWKATHMLSYPAMWLVAMHGLQRRHRLVQPRPARGGDGGRRPDRRSSRCCAS